MADRKKQTRILVWAGTIALAAIIIGGALVIGQKPAAPVQEETATPVPAAKTEASISPVTAPVPAAGKGYTRETDPLYTLDLAGTLKLAVPVLWEGSNRLPLDYTCYRSNVTPPVEWAGVPPDTKSLALVMEKRAGDRRKTYWLLYNIPASEDGLAAHLPAGPELENGARYGRSDHGVIQYAGPCDPKGKIPYAFRLYALDTVLDLETGAEDNELGAAMKGHILDIAEQPFIHYLRF